MTKKFGYKVKINQQCENEWQSFYSNCFEKISRTKDIPDVVSDFDIQKAELCYVVWVEYSCGDSFGMSENEGVEAVGVFKDKECARQLVKAIKDSNEKYRRDEIENCETWADKYKFYFKTSDGQEFKYGSCPWYGYFNVLQNVYVEEAVME